MVSTSSHTTFAQALERFAAMLANEDEDVAPECHSRLLHHGDSTESCYLLLHGFTNCPAQFAEVARELHERGSNVLVPLAEGHGRSDGSPHVLTNLSTTGLASYLTDVVQIASGLGRRLVVVGFSFGGVCASWASVHLSAVDEVFVVSPAFLPFGFPVGSARILPAISRLLPERYLWWDPVRKEGYRGAPYSYRKLSRRGIGAVFELGQEAWWGRPRRERSLDRAVLVVNENDMAISPAAAVRSFERAVAPLAEKANVRTIEAALRLPHDFIDPLGANREREAVGRRLLLEILLGD